MAVYPYYCGEGGGAVSPSVSQTHTVSPPVKACMGYSRQQKIKSISVSVREDRKSVV